MAMEPQTQSAGLPATRNFVTTLINALQSPDSTSPTPLDHIPQSKPILLTLHVLFPNELLPALDLLDRNLVTKLRLAPSSPSSSSSSSPPNPNTVRPQQSTYYVRSAQQHRSNARALETTTYYEVHLNAWSCSCPAFAFAAFPAHQPETSHAPHPPSSDLSNGAEKWRVGGLTLGGDLPVCKHLLACVLGAHSDAFAHLVEEREVSADEWAGWAAGWGG